jgi:hypothetical protein
MNMQTYSYFLSQVLGLFFFLLAVIVMMRLHFYRKLILELKVNNPVITLAGIFGLLMGILLVLTHNIWSFRASVWITFIAWLILLTSILWLIKTDYMLAITKKTCSGIGYYWVILLLLVIGTGVQRYILYHITPYI